MDIRLTAAALGRMKEYLKHAPNTAGVRFGVKRTGCSGWGYVIDCADQPTPEDIVCEHQGIRLFVDANVVPLVQGTEIDFVRQGLNHQFVFHNPNAAAECGCGASFTTGPG